jgi:hypothetical protein
MPIDAERFVERAFQVLFERAADAGDRARREACGVGNSDHVLDLRIRDARRRRANALSDAREAGNRPSTPVALGTKPWVHAEPFRAGPESVGLRSHPLRLGGQVPEAGHREA